MRLEPPLSNLFARCVTQCVAECCGIDAYDFNPIHVASYLLMYRGEPDPHEIDQIRAQLDSLKSNYGSAGASGHGATFQDLNQGLDGSEVDALVDHLLSALDTALSLIGQVPPGIAAPGRRHQ